MIKYLLFDIDDTLLDFGKAEAYAISRAFSEVGIPVTDGLIARYSEINDFVWSMLEKGEMTREEILLYRFSLLFEERGIKVEPEKIQKIYEWRLGEGHYFIDGAPELLDALYGKYKLYIVSNGTLSVQERRIKSSGIGKNFEDIFISERIGHNKPSREFFDTCFARIPDFNKTEALIIGDRLSSDILGGINCGVKTCWYNPAAVQNTTEIIPDHEIRHLNELPVLLESLRN